MPVQAGTRLGPYEVTGALGAGGMGVVYAGFDTRLGRRVAIKLLPSDTAADPERQRRFLQEARAASTLNHPNIAQIFDVLDMPPEDGAVPPQGGSCRALIMELVDGTPLDRILAAGAPPPAIALDYAAQIAAALEAAHAAGIVHRDIKPANIMVTRDGRVKVLDFGLAKLAALPGDATVTSAATQLGTIMGTAAYMSPEQAQGLPVDARSDIFSLGAVLYEMLAGRRPFAGDTELAAITSILTQEPAPITGVPRAIAAIVDRSLRKAPDARYASAAAMRTDLSAALAHVTAARDMTWRRPSILVPAGLALAAVVAYGTWETVQARGVKWAREQAIPAMESAQLTSHTMDAVRLARLAEKYAPDEVGRIRATWVPFRLQTVPAGAEIEVKNYEDINGAWEKLGSSPVEVVLPFGYYRFRLTKPGYRTLEGAGQGRTLTFILTRDGEHAGMVAVAGGEYSFGVSDHVTLADYWIGRTEVTNREYKTFVDAGGYRRPEYWKEPFVDGDRTLTFAEAMTRFRDATGLAGPSTWEVGSYKEGQADYPVGGISWFEAAAYARFAGKRLPSVFHWFKASGADEIYSDILLLSNFDGKGPSRAGERPDISPTGALDMAGNVKEWCSNPYRTSVQQRFIVGGGWNEPSYRFSEPEAQNAWDRRATYGMRLLEDTAVSPAADAPVGRVRPDPNTNVPIPDAELEPYTRFYAYDRTPLDVRPGSIDDSHPGWTREAVSIAAAYGGERVPLYLFLPKHGAPPYQTIVYFPTSYARNVPSSAHLDIAMFDFLMKSGRAVVYPVYQGTFERRSAAEPGTTAYRDMQVQWAKDFFRVVDYLQTRRDVDHEHLGFFSISMGSYFAPIPIALEARIKAAVLIAGGLRYNYPPEIQPVNFMPRVRVPVLLINGDADFETPPAARERYLELLGSTEKKRITLEGGHVPSDITSMIRETLTWYDRYLGTVR
jgi:formylglycine-generating enzyme required for sulfatase activity/dienelactone hydrolase